LSVLAQELEKHQIGMTVVGLIVFALVFVLVFLPRFNAFPQP
jgi:hypothetical protein